MGCSSTVSYQAGSVALGDCSPPPRSTPAVDPELMITLVSFDFDNFMSESDIPKFSGDPTGHKTLDLLKGSYVMASLMTKTGSTAWGSLH